MPSDTKSIKPTGPAICMLESLSDGGYPDIRVIARNIMEAEARTMFNFTSPDEKKIEYYIQKSDDKYVIFSKVYPLNRDGTGVAHNYVAEKDSLEEAEELVAKIKRL